MISWTILTTDLIISWLTEIFTALDYYDPCGVDATSVVYTDSYIYYISSASV